MSTPCMVAAFARSRSTPLFDQIVRRPDASVALLAAIEGRQVTPATLGPGQRRAAAHAPQSPGRAPGGGAPRHASPAGKAKSRHHRRAHCRRSRSQAMPAKGKALFTGACASCHKLGDVGKSEVGPPLNGMGAHGRAELLRHIIDPNREVDPSFWQWNVTTKKGETLTGVIASENASRPHAAQHERRRRDQEGRHRDAREHAPLADARRPRGARRRGAARHPHVHRRGADAGRRAEVPHHRPARGVYRRQPPRPAPRRRARRDRHAAPVRRCLGRRRAVLHHGSGAVAERRNLVALKGGPGQRQPLRRLPQRVEIPTAVTAASLHFLGGVGGGPGRRAATRPAARRR